VLENAISPQAQSPGAEEAKEATDGIPPVDSSSPIDSFAGPEETASQATESPPYLEPSPHHNYSKLPPVLRLLSSRRLLAALWGCTVQATLTTTFDSVLPIFVKESFEWDSIGGGLVFLAFIIPSFGAPIVGKISDRYGPRWLAVGGFIFSIPFWILLRFVDHNSLNQKVLLCALLSLIGVGLVLVMSPLMAEITYVVEAKEKKNPGLYGSNGAYAQAYALFVMAFAAGTLIGPIWGGYVVKAAGWGTMTWSLSLLSLSGAVPVLIWTGGLITRDNAKTGDERAIGAPAMVNVMAIESDIEKQI
jgi:MFS family permease